MRDSALLKTPAPRPAAPPAIDPDRWAEAGVEPTVEELMADPLTALVMRRDRIGTAEVMAAVEGARRALTPQPTQSQAFVLAAVPPVPLARPPATWRPATRRARFTVEERLPLAGAL